jgi:SNF2 family DNA or RNA helicase
LLAHQRRIIAFARGRGCTFVAADPGTGKTLVGIELLEQWNARAIWVCPNQTTGTIVAEFRKWNSRLRAKRLEGTRQQRIASLRRNDWDVVVVNYECTRTLFQELIDTLPTVVIFDESQEIKNRTSQQTIACRKLAKHVVAEAKAEKALWGEHHCHTMCFTGTPITKDLRDLWSQCDVLMPVEPAKHILGFGPYMNYEKSVAVAIPYRVRIQTKRGPKMVTLHRYEFPEDRVRLVTERMARFTQLARKQDCLDLPERIEQTILCDMTPQQQKTYDDLRKHTIAEIDGGTVSANMAMTLFTRLQQVTSGFVKLDKSKDLLDLPSAKLDTLRDMLPDLTAREGDHKLVVWCRFTHDVDQIDLLCQEMGIGVEILDGRTSKHTQAICDKFNNDPDTRVLVGNVAMGVGITLTGADYEMFYSHSHVGEHRMQAEHRVHRQGQTRKVTCYNMVIANSVDEAALENNVDKKNLAALTLADLRALLV